MDLEIAGLEAIWIEIFVVRSRSILVCFSYKPPDSSDYIYENFTTKFRDVIETATCENKETLLAGDLNCNFLVCSQIPSVITTSPGMVRRMHVEKFKTRNILTRDYSKYDKEAFQHELQSIDWMDVLLAGEINSSWNLFKRNLTAVVDRHAPFVEKRVRGRDCAWLTTETKNKMNERDYQLQKARETGNKQEWSACKRLRNEITNAS